MNPFKALAAGLVAGALIAPMISQAADGDADRAKPAAFVKDSVITTKVKAKLAAEKVSSLAKIHVDTDRNGVVVLSGTAKDQSVIDTAVNIAKATEGVASVTNHITVKP